MPVAEVLQGLIQVAALLEQYERMKPRGVRNLWAKAEPRLDAGLGPHLGLDIARLRADLKPYVEPVLADDASMGLRPQDIQLARVGSRPATS